MFQPRASRSSEINRALGNGLFFGVGIAAVFAVVAGFSGPAQAKKKVEASHSTGSKSDVRYYRGNLSDRGYEHHRAISKRLRWQWSFRVGAPLVGTPALSRDASGDLIVVGDHAGRVVALRASGPVKEQGTLVRSWTLGGQVWSGAVVDDAGRIYIGADDDTLYAIDPEKDEFLWTLKLGSCEAPRAPGPEGSRCDLDGGPTRGPNGDLYVGGEGVFRVDPHGGLIWRWPDSPGPHEHVATAPLVMKDGRVYVGTQGGRIVALGNNGKVRWSYDIESDVDSAIIATQNGFFCAGSDDGKVYCLDDKGSLRWSFRGQKDFRAALGHVQSGTSEWIVAPSYDGSIYGLSVYGQMRWQLQIHTATHATPVVDHRHQVYVGSRDGMFYVIDGRRGKIRAKTLVPAAVDGGALVMTNGTIVFGADDGVLRAYR